LTATIYLARYRRTVLVTDGGKSRAALIPKSHNYPGFKGIPGPDLLARLREQAQTYGAVIHDREVGTLRREAAGIFVAEWEGGRSRARSVVLATGLIDHTPESIGMNDPLAGGLIRYCPICDGYEAMDKRIGVVGPIGDAGKKALFLRTYSRDVWLFATDITNGASELKNQLMKAGVRLTGKPRRIQRNSRTLTVGLEGGDQQDLDVLYAAMGCCVRSQLATTLAAACTESGNLKVDEHQQTTVNGLYAIGDVVSDLHQLSVAIGHAAIAATHIHNRLPPRYR
jgi:thioredoxin reductase (NADPH)